MPDAAEFAELVSAPANSRIEIRSLADFFARHTTTADPFDVEAQKIRPRYEQLIGTLGRRLRGVQVYRLGNVEVTCYITGFDGEGNLSGLRTIAIET
jgi:hypothetical protein